MLKCFAIILAILVAAFVAVVLLVPLIVPTGQDAEISNAICKSFQMAATNILANKDISIAETPRRGQTILLVSGNLSDSGKKTLLELADKIGQTNGNRSVMVIFK